jgi:hypothetical protein
MQPTTTTLPQRRSIDGFTRTPSTTTHGPTPIQAGDSGARTAGMYRPGDRSRAGQPDGRSGSASVSSPDQHIPAVRPQPSLQLIRGTAPRVPIELTVAQPEFLESKNPARERSVGRLGAVQQTPQKLAETGPKRVYAKAGQQAEKRRWHIPAALQLPLMVTVAVIAGFGAQSYAFGEVAVVMYGVIAVICNIPSRTTFTLGAISMVATTLALILQGNVQLSQNFATDTFLLLVVGVISLGRELKKEGGRVYSRRNY